MRGPVSAKVSVGFACLLLVASVAVLWLPWFPLNPRVECGWTCYTPLRPGQPPPSFLHLDGRSGLSAAGLASVVTVLASIIAVAVTAWRRRQTRFAPHAVVVAGLVALVASTFSVFRITGADSIVVTGQGASLHTDATAVSGSYVRFGEASMGLGALIALAAGVGVSSLGVWMLTPRLRPGSSRRGERRAAETRA